MAKTLLPKSHLMQKAHLQQEGKTQDTEVRGREKMGKRESSMVWFYQPLHSLSASVG